jgi:hypothetical protein
MAQTLDNDWPVTPAGSHLYPRCLFPSDNDAKLCNGRRTPHAGVQGGARHGGPALPEGSEPPVLCLPDAASLTPFRVERSFYSERKLFDRDLTLNDHTAPSLLLRASSSGIPIEELAINLAKSDERSSPYDTQGWNVLSWSDNKLATHFLDSPRSCLA